MADIISRKSLFRWAGWFALANSVVFGLIGTVLKDLEQRRLMDKTVVLITSDHGEEFGESSAVYEHRTSHYDIIPTLMQNARFFRE
jgi:membrane-anchored protein YejM (alkaline phosphatase superfamily)